MKTVHKISIEVVSLSTFYYSFQKSKMEQSVGINFAFEAIYHSKISQCSPFLGYRLKTLYIVTGIHRILFLCIIVMSGTKDDIFAHHSLFNFEKGCCSQVFYSNKRLRLLAFRHLKKFELFLITAFEACYLHFPRYSYSHEWDCISSSSSLSSLLSFFAIHCFMIKLTELMFVEFIL